jgi:hypothetical protein
VKTGIEILAVNFTSSLDGTKKAKSKTIEYQHQGSVRLVSDSLHDTTYSVIPASSYQPPIFTHDNGKKKSSPY